MRPILTLVSLLGSLTLPEWSGVVYAQTTALVAPGLGVIEARMMFQQFLIRRWEITRRSPVVRLCGPEAQRLVTPELIQRLTRKEYPLAYTVEVMATCPFDSITAQNWRPTPLPDLDLVIIRQLMAGPVSSGLDAVVSLAATTNGPLPRSRLERYDGGHPGAVDGGTLQFTEFHPATITTKRDPASAYSTEWVVREIFHRRLEVTGRIPALQFCGPAGRALMTPELIADLTSTDQQVATSIVVAEECPSQPGNYRAQGIPMLVVVKLVGSSESGVVIDGEFNPGPGGEPYPHGRNERYEWDNREGYRGVTLTFRRFSPPD